MGDINRESEPRILVVGAGIAGLGVARALAQRGIRVDVVEREPTWVPAGAGIYLPGNAVRALRALGLESAVTERAAAIPRQLLCDHRGRLLSQIDVASLWGDVGACVPLHRADLHEVLLSSSGGVEVRTGMPVRRLRQDGGTVGVEFGDGSTGDYELVIGADGLHSTYCDAPARVGPPEFGAQNLSKHLADFGGPVPAVLGSLGPATAVHEGPIEEVVLSGWTRGSVVLIGDAAHATSPNMAEGAAMALEDGLVLAECLASQPVSRALTTFERRRLPRSQWVRAQTHRRDRTRGLPPVVRNLVLRRWGRQIFHHNYGRLREAP